MYLASSNKSKTFSSEDESLWFYNGLDCAVTLKSWQAMQNQRTPFADISYNFVSAMRAPALEMMLRGIKVDMEQRAAFLQHYAKNQTFLQDNLNQFAQAVWDKPLNTASPKQMKEFFYEAMNLPHVYKFDKGVKKLSTDRDALEKLGFHFHAQPMVNTALKIREVEKKLQFIKSGIDSDNRIRTSFNVVGTETGRWSSSENPFGSGGNQQNITDELRRMFIADDGMKMFYIDLEQAESRVVAYVSGDINYIAAFESGDLHTTVAKMVWPDLGWTGVLKEDKALAEQPFYRHFSYRDIAKRLGHGTNYNGQPRTMAGILKIPETLVAKFQDSYFTAFPGIRKWHHSVAAQLQTKGYIITALGRKRNFLGRRYDDTTLREAIAFEPQSTVGEILNLFLYRVWKHCRRAQCLAQIHDAILGQFPAELEAELIPELLSYAEIPVHYPCGTMTIPADAMTGWNWAKGYGENTHGLRKYKGHDDRLPPIYKGILDWEIH